MNKKPADQTHHKLCQRITELNKIDACLHSSSHKQAVYEFSFFFPTENISYSSMLTGFCSLCSWIYGMHVRRWRGKELNLPFKNVCPFALEKYHLNRQQE